MSVTRTIVMDFFAIFAFAVLARMAHHTTDPFTLTNVLNTLWPFLVGGAIITRSAPRQAPAAHRPRRHR